MTSLQPLFYHADRPAQLLHLARYGGAAPYLLSSPKIGAPAILDQVTLDAYDSGGDYMLWQLFYSANPSPPVTDWPNLGTPIFRWAGTTAFNTHRMLLRTYVNKPYAFTPRLWLRDPGQYLHLYCAAAGPETDLLLTATIITASDLQPPDLWD